jgi:hypothetical protein
MPKQTSKQNRNKTVDTNQLFRTSKTNSLNPPDEDVRKMQPHHSLSFSATNISSSNHYKNPFWHKQAINVLVWKFQEDPDDVNEYPTRTFCCQI